jgi:putative ABC transport system permease protein
MHFKNLLKVAIKSILKSRMRSLLTALGIIIGVAAVVVMVALGDGAQIQVEKQISSLGSNLIIIFPGSISSRGIRMGAGSINRFTMEDVKRIRDEATLIKAVTPVVRTGGQVIGGVGNWSTQIQGVDPDFLEIRDWPLASGDFFTQKDMISRAKVAVLGQTVVQQLFPNEDPIGQQIRIRNVPFRVIGVLTAKGQSAMGSDQDDIIFAPATTVLDRLVGGIYISYIQASAVSTSQIDAAQAQLTQIMREAHHLNPGEDNDFTVRNQAEITQAATETSRILTILLASVAGVSLIVGGIGIMNIMLVSVTERTREIGIRLSVGARTSDVLIQFLTEAIVLSLAGGLIGVLLSFGIVLILNQYTGMMAVISPEIILIAVSFSGIIGIFFGFYPARKAANLNPIDALRYE